MRRSLGVGLGTVLVVVSLVVTLGFALAGASIQHLNVQSRLTNSSRALDVARAAVNLGLERCLTDQEYGKNTGADTLQEFKDGQGAVGRMTFNPTQATLYDIPVSINNLTGTEVKAGSTGQVVPLKTVHLVAIGSFRNVTRKVEVILSLPPYPYAAASDGPISARQVIVGAVPPGTALGMPPSKLRPANMLSNAGGGQALVLGESSTVTGDLMAKGGIKVDQRAQVKGLVRPNQEERELPIWKVEDYDPKLLGRPYMELEARYTAGSTIGSAPVPTPPSPTTGLPTTGLPSTVGTDPPGDPPVAIPTPGPSGAVKFTGTLRREGNLDVEGDLDVEGALLFVSGNLTVNGALTGKGVVVTSGDLTVRDHAEIDARDKVALLAKKKLTLKGEGRMSSLITGILYSEGGFEASQLTLRGVVISREGASGDKPVTFNGTRLVRDPEPVAITVAPTTAAGTFSVTLKGGTSQNDYLDPGATGRGTSLVPKQEGPTVVTQDSFVETRLAPDNSLVADFVASPNPADPTQTMYSVTFRPNLFTLEGWYGEKEICDQIARLAGLDSSQVLLLFQQANSAILARPKTVASSFTLTVKEPSQLLPFYQQARITFWKED